jgi:hypothetical protein
MTDEQQRPIVVVAGNYQQFVAFCHDNGFNPRQRGLIYAGRPESLRGLGPVEVVYTGTAYERRDFAEIYDRLRIMDTREWEPDPAPTRKE